MVRCEKEWKHEPERAKSDTEGDERECPTDETPLGIGFLNQAGGQVEESEESEKKPEDRGQRSKVRGRRAEVRRRFALARQVRGRRGRMRMEEAVEEVGAEERDGPAVGVLFVERPLDAEMVDQVKPEPSQ